MSELNKEEWWQVPESPEEDAMVLCAACPNGEVQTILAVMPEQLGPIIGFRFWRGRIVVKTRSGIHMIIRRQDGMENAMFYLAGA